MLETAATPLSLPASARATRLGQLTLIFVRWVTGGRCWPLAHMLGTIAFGTSPKNMDCARIRLLHVPAPDLIVVFILLNLLLAP